MIRVVALIATVVTLSGCSLILDFSPGAIPKDAMTDAPYTMTDCLYMEPNDTIATATTITPGVDTGPAAICPLTGVDDLDYYKFTVPAGTTKVTVSIDDDDRLGDIDLRLYDATEAVVAQSRGLVGGETIVCPAASPPCPTLAAGDYVFEVFGSTPGATNRYTFAVMLE